MNPCPMASRSDRDVLTDRNRRDIVFYRYHGCTHVGTGNVISEMAMIIPMLLQLERKDSKIFAVMIKTVVRTASR